MSGPIFSPSWYRVAALTPRLRSHARIHRHRYRGQTWFVLQDRVGGRFHRFSTAAHVVIGLMDGRRSVQDIWDTATTRLGDDAPSQGEMIQLLGQLHAADVLQCDVPPDTRELLERHERQVRRSWQSRLLSPFAWQFPLFDPDRLLLRLLPVVRPLIGWPGAILWLLMVVPAVVLGAVHWADLSQDFTDRVLRIQSLALLWLLFPVVKTLHEFGHAFAARAFGGEVHEIGVMVLVLTPVPYVDASAASAFRNKWQRIAVGAAGMVVELFVAAGAFYLWLAVEPGTIRVLAYDTVIIAGITTVAFNANPLVRYDGYYILADLLEIPNLASRARAYVAYLCERHLFGQHRAESPVTASGERVWLASYAVASTVYRALIVVGITLFLLGRFFYLGMLLVLLGAVGYVIVPLGRGVSFVLTHPRLERVRTRAIGMSGATVALIVLLTAVLPLPLRTRAEGVIWIPDEAFVRAGTDGFVERVVAVPGAPVSRGDVLFELRDPVVRARATLLAGRIRELEARYAAERIADLVRAQLTKEEIRFVADSLGQARRREADLTVRAGTDGTFVCPLAPDLPGRFARQGELLAHVIDLETITARAVIPQADIDLVRGNTRGVQVRLADRVFETIPAAMKRVVPGASEHLPSRVLGTEGGGQVAVDPRDRQGATSMEKMFQIELELPASAPVVNLGGRVHVRFDHGYEPLMAQWYRRARQLFLSRFSV